MSRLKFRLVLSSEFSPKNRSSLIYLTCNSHLNSFPLSASTWLTYLEWRNFAAKSELCKMMRRILTLTWLAETRGIPLLMILLLLLRKLLSITKSFKWLRAVKTRVKKILKNQVKRKKRKNKFKRLGVRRISEILINTTLGILTPSCLMSRKTRTCDFRVAHKASTTWDNFPLWHTERLSRWMMKSFGRLRSTTSNIKNSSLSTCSPKTRTRQFPSHRGWKSIGRFKIEVYI